MANTDTSYQINYQGKDIQKQLDYVNAIKEVIQKNENDLITIDALNTVTLTTNNLTANTIAINSTITATDATITNNIKASAFHTANNGHLTDTGLTTPTINVAEDNSNQTYITPNGIRAKSVYLGTSNGSAEIGSWEKENSLTGGYIYGLTIASPINFDANVLTQPNTLRIKNINTILELPNEDDPQNEKNTITHSFGKLIHQINYVSSLETFLPITKDENNNGVSRINLNNISAITANTINASSATLGNIYSSGTTTLSRLNTSQINSDALVMSESSYATIPTATVNSLTLNAYIDAGGATATFNEVNTSTLSAISSTFGNTITNNAQIFDLTVNNQIPSLSVNNLSATNIMAPASNYVSNYQQLYGDIDISDDNYADYNGMLLINGNDTNIIINLDVNITHNIEFEVLRFGSGNVSILSTSANIIANEKLTSTAQIKKQYDVIGVKNFIINDTMYWLITGNMSA